MIYDKTIIVTLALSWVLSHSSKWWNLREVTVTSHIFRQLVRNASGLETSELATGIWSEGSLGEGGLGNSRVCSRLARSMGSLGPWLEAGVWVVLKHSVGDRALTPAESDTNSGGQCQNWIAVHQLLSEDLTWELKWENFFHYTNFFK